MANAQSGKVIHGPKMLKGQNITLKTKVEDDHKV